MLCERTRRYIYSKATFQFPSLHALRFISTVSNAQNRTVWFDTFHLATMLFDYCRCNCQLSKRWETILLVTSGVIVVYTLRVNMSVAAQEMREELNWDEEQKGLVLSSFYWGYTIGQIPASRFVRIHGFKWLYGLSVLIPSILTMLVPVASRQSFSGTLLIRFLVGLFESASFPALYHMWPIWFPANEKTKLIPFVMSGLYMGPIVGLGLSGIFIGRFGWPSVFYIFSIVGIIWFCLFALIVHESPEVHPYISDEERHLIVSGRSVGMLVVGSTPGTPMRTMTSRSSSSNNNKKRGTEGVEMISSRSASSSLSPLSLNPAHIKSGLHTFSTITGDEDHDDHFNEDDDTEDFVRIDFRTDKNTAITSSSNNSNNNKSNNVSHSMNSRIISCNNTEYMNNVTSESALESEGGEGITPTRGNYMHVSGEVRGNIGEQEHSDDDNDVRQSSSSSSNNGCSGTTAIDTISIANGTPWRQFLSNKVSLSLFVNNWTFGWINFLLISEMPSLLSDALGFSVEQAGVLSVFPYFALYMATIIFGKLFSHLQCEKGMSTTAVRHWGQFLALGVASVSLIIVGAIGASNRYLSFTLLIIGQFFFGAINVSLHCIYSDVAPTYASALNSLGNCIASVAGICGPAFVGVLTTRYPENGGIWGWRWTFIITACMSAVSLPLWAKNVRADVVDALNTPKLD